jgi:hypothetical protein
VLDEWPQTLCERFATQEPLTARVCAKLLGIPDFLAPSDLLAGVDDELSQVRRDLIPVAGELGRVLFPFFDDVRRILEVRPSSQGGLTLRERAGVRGNA